MKKRYISVLLVLVILLTSSCSITKTKDLSAYPDLLHGTTNFSLSDHGYNATLVTEGSGVKVSASSSSLRDGGWLVLMYYDGQTRNLLADAAGDKYTIVFEAKTNTAGINIPVSHRNGNGQETQIEFGTATIPKANKWIQIILTGELLGVPANTQGLYFNLSFIPANTEISIRNLKLIKGTV